MKYTAWQNIKWIVSLWLLRWAVTLLPENSHEYSEMLGFTTQYIQRSIERMEK